MKLIWLIAAMVGLSGLAAYAAPSPWEQPAASLADQVAAILGPGQAHLTIQNLSSISTDEIPAIRRLLTQDLKAHGVAMAGAESANTVRVTLSESVRERLWVAEIGEGNQTQVAIVDLGPIQPQQAPTVSGLTLSSRQILVARDPLLAVLEIPNGLVALEPEQVVLYAHTAEGWQEQKHLSIEQRRQLARDPRGALLGYGDGLSFDAWLPGVHCTGSFTFVPSPIGSNFDCRESDDPWAVTQPPLHLTESSGGATEMNVTVTPIRAFYNASRSYFTGVLAPNNGPDLPPFYSAALIPRVAGSAALLVGGIDGKVQLVENGALKPVAGTRDWGSDFAVLQSSCGAGTQVIASSSGEAASDSLRAFELPALEAVPASVPLTMDGTVTALWTTPDGKSVLAVVRNAANQYEVDRVTVLCN
ncbi:MAG: hypothetical protein ABSC62_14225 [Terracidiphilus sp.]|jgi:hypothetical protein